jgi:hypothetical protein
MARDSPELKADAPDPRGSEVARTNRSWAIPALSGVRCRSDHTHLD